MVRSVVAVSSSVPSAELQKRPTHATQPKRGAGVPDPHDEPSVDWGWHGTLPRGTMIGTVFVIIALFGMLIGNQQGHVEDIYLILTGVIMIGLLLLTIRRRRRAWRR